MLSINCNVQITVQKYLHKTKIIILIFFFRDLDYKLLIIKSIVLLIPFYHMKKYFSSTEYIPNTLSYVEKPRHHFKHHH